MKILVLYVEDNHINRIIVKKLLDHRYEVHAVETPQEAIQLATKNNYDVALIDLNLNHPDVDGFGVLQELRKQPNLGDTIFIAHTNYFGEDWKKKCLDAGFDYYFPKPFKLDVFESFLQDSSKFQEFKEESSS